MKPRYAIVRVDKEHYLNSCPSGFEEINNDFVCSYNKDTILYQKDKTLNQYVCDCSKCRYGDTKEQLIRKVAQVLIKDEMKYCKWKTKVQKEVCWQNNMELAKEIVEFLGVEE